MNDDRTVWEDVDGRQKYTFLAESSFRHVLKQTTSKQSFSAIIFPIIHTQ
jgi:hypothetical protein